MANGQISGSLKDAKSHIPAWLSPKVDAAISVSLAYASVLVGGYGLLLTSQSWQSSPLVVVGLILWGVSCMGLRRLFDYQNHHD